MAASFYVNESRLAQIEEETEGNESMISQKENKTPRTAACPSKKSRITMVGDPNLEQSLLEMSTMSFANTSMRRPSESGPFGNVSHRLDFSTSQISESGALGDVSQRSEMPSDRTLKENSFLLFDNNSPRGTVRALEETSCSVRTADDTFSALGEIKGIADQLQQQLALEEKLKEATSSQQTALAQLEALKAENATLLQKMKDAEEKALNAELKAKTADEKVQSAQEELTSAVEKLERCLVEKASLDGLPVKVADEITPLLGELETNITEAIHNASLRQNQSILEKNEQIAQLEFKLAESETELATLEEEMAIRNERISAQEEEIASLEEKVTTLKEEMAKECEELDKKEEKLTAEAYNAKKEMLEVKIQFGIITPEEAVHQLGDAGALQDFMKLICTN